MPSVEATQGTQRYRPTQREDEDRLTQAIVALASQYGRYGYRRITALLQRAGGKVGKDRVDLSLNGFAIVGAGPASLWNSLQEAIE